MMTYKIRNKKLRLLRPDYKYNSLIIGRFINYLMWDGKKAVAVSIIYDCCEILTNKFKVKDVVDYITNAINKCSPKIRITSRKKGGGVYQIPKPISEELSFNVTMKKLVQCARIRKEYTMSERLAAELNDAFNETGSTFKHKQNILKTAEANKVFVNMF